MSFLDIPIDLWATVATGIALNPTNGVTLDLFVGMGTDSTEPSPEIWFNYFKHQLSHWLIVGLPLVLFLRYTAAPILGPAYAGIFGTVGFYFLNKKFEILKNITLMVQ